MLFLSWNVNGLRSALSKGLLYVVRSADYDAVLLQEIKADTVPLELSTLGYECFIYPASRRGYSGTLSLVKLKPLSVSMGIGVREFDEEGRVITLEYPEFYLVNAYFPNAQRGLTRLEYKLRFNSKFEEYAQSLRKRKPLVICGDFNVAHTELDIARPKDNVNNAGFTKEERDWMTRFLSLGYLDTFRLFVEGGWPLHLVDIQIQRPREEHRLANRLLRGFRGAKKKGCELGDSWEHKGLRPCARVPRTQITRENHGYAKPTNYTVIRFSSDHVYAALDRPRFIAGFRVYAFLDLGNVNHRKIHN